MATNVGATLSAAAVAPSVSSQPTDAMPKFPPLDPNFDWVQSQAPRHEAATTIYGGKGVTGTDMRADSLLQPLYSSAGAKEAVEHALARMGPDGGAVSSQPPPAAASGDGDGQNAEKDWVHEDGQERSHASANFLQVRLASQILTRFQPFRHTVIIAGRPMQVMHNFVVLPS